MKRRILCFVLTMAMVLSMLVVVPAVTATADTYNYSDDPTIHISTAADLGAFRDAVNSGTDFSGKTVYLEDNIDLSGITYSVGQLVVRVATCIGSMYEYHLRPIVCRIDTHFLLRGER